MQDYRTTVLGFLLGALTYAQGVGAKLPTTRSEWAAFFIACALAGLGYVAKDAKGPGSKVLLLFLLPSLLLGCTATNISDVIKAMGTDPATVCGKISTPWGTGQALRTNIVQGEVSCDGMTVKSQGSTSIPITIAPQAPAPVPPVGP